MAAKVISGAKTAKSVVTVVAQIERVDVRSPTFNQIQPRLDEVLAFDQQTAHTYILVKSAFYDLQAAISCNLCGQRILSSLTDYRCLSLLNKPTFLLRSSSRNSVPSVYAKPV